MVRVNISSENIKLKDLINLYGILCESDNIEKSERDERTIELNFKNLKKDGRMECRFSLSNKLYVERRGGNITEIWDTLYYQEEEKRTEFDKKVIGYFNEKV